MKKYSYSLPELFGRLMAIARPIRGYLVISALASIVGNLSHMGLMGFGACALLSAAGVLQGHMWLYIALALLCGALIAVCRYLEGVFSHIGAYGVLAKLRVDLFRVLARLSPAFMVDHRQGDMLNIAVSDIETLEFFFAHTIGPMFTVILLPVTTVVIAWHFSRLFALVLIPIYILVSVVLPTAALAAGRSIGMKYRTALGNLKAVILESVYGIRDIQIFGLGEKRKSQVLRANDEVKRAAHGMMLHQQTVSSLPNFFVYLARILIIGVAAYLAGRGEGSAAGTVIVSFVATASFSSSFSLTFVVTHLLETFAAAERLFLIEDSAPAVVEAQDPAPLPAVDEVRFVKVGFRYPGAEQEVLKNLGLCVRKGEKLGIAGESGAGKSTIIRLLMRFYEATEGSVSYAGIPAREASLRDLHRRVAMLEQDTYLFDGTIRENIALAKPDATLAEIQEAARRAGIADFIATLPQGYDTPMGQMGARLSGGERQRVGIARIMLADPDVIVMDEPTSALDVLHEKELLHTLNTEYADKTVIIISHRMSTLSGSGRILRLTGGRLVEDQASTALARSGK